MRRCPARQRSAILQRQGSNETGVSDHDRIAPRRTTPESVRRRPPRLCSCPRGRRRNLPGSAHCGWPWRYRPSSWCCCRPSSWKQSAHGRRHCRPGGHAAGPSRRPGRARAGSVSPPGPLVTYAYRQRDSLNRRSVLERAGEAPELIVVPDALGGQQPLCAVYRRSLLSLIEQALQNGDYKIGHLFSHAPTRYIAEGEMRKAGFSPEIFRNVNTAEEYASLLQDARLAPRRGVAIG